MGSVRIGAGPSFETGRPCVLFSASAYFQNPFHQQFDVAPDGQRFLMSRLEAGSDPGIVLVFNFLDDLKQRMAAR